MPDAEIYLIPPPRPAPSAELPPHLGSLRLVPYSGELPEETEPFTAQPADDVLTPELAARILERALRHPRVRERLGGRWEPIGVSRFDTKGEAPAYTVVAYNYETDLAVEVSIDGRGEEVADITESRTQPAVTAAEVDRAVALAAADGRLDPAEIADLEAMAIQVAPAGLAEADANHRIVEVLFAACGQRLPRHRIWVDLSTERVLKVGRADRDCCCGGEGVQRR